MEKRKRIMARSIRLGHCVCDPKKACPCDIFKQKNICLCAGERLEEPAGPVFLTRLIEKAGCESKIDQAFLKQVLHNLPVPDDPRVLVGVPAGDDAGVYDIGNGKAMVQTVDVFTPSVDDPYVFGQIAAANSVSDIYAMGGTPLTALSVLGFPIRKLPDNVMYEILRGGIDKMNEAGVSIIGGHSINDQEIKAGFAVTGFIEPNKIVTNSGAKVGDVLILTKPLGTGIIAFAAQIERAEKESIEATAKSMAALNKKASELMVEYQAHACTDVTGFGLMGHLTEMASSSGVDVEIIWDDIPVFPHVIDYMANGIIPGGVERNRESCADKLILGENVSQEMADICFDAQTSGGLLIAIEKTKSEKFLSALHKAGISDAVIIGKITAKGSGNVSLKTNNNRKFKPQTPNKNTINETDTTTEKQKPLEQPQSLNEACCANGHSSLEVSADNQSLEIQHKFQEFLKAVNTPAELDAATKQVISIALSVLSRCEPCLKAHIKKARNMGFSQKEIDEAAWMGIAFGGSPAMMFYNNLKNE